MKKTNQLGFVHLMGLFAMTMMASFAVVIAFLFHAGHSKSEFRKFCFIDLPRLQSNIEQATNSVLALNPIAANFNFQISLTTAQLLVAQATNNAPLVLHLSRMLQQLKMHQYQFGQKQKALIRTLEVGINLKAVMFTSKSLNAINQNNVNWKDFVFALDHVSIQPQTIKLPIEPEDAKSPAPIYRIKPKIESATRITASWNSSVFANKTNQTLQDQSTHWRFTCAVEQKIKRSYGVPVVRVQFETVVKADKL